MDEKEYIEYLIKTTVESIRRDFTEETKVALEAYR